VLERIDKVELEHRMQLKAERKNENYYFLTITMSLTIDVGPKGNVQTEKWTALPELGWHCMI
jgi:hypothetical protein